MEQPFKNKILLSNFLTMVSRLVENALSPPYVIKPVICNNICCTQVEHYRQTGFPLAVKLGTITADGKGDVFSYAEDDMVEDPFLADHLKHFGINVQQLQKVLFTYEHKNHSR